MPPLQGRGLRDPPASRQPAGYRGLHGLRYPPPRRDIPRAFHPHPIAGTLLLLAAAVISGYDVLKDGLLALIQFQFNIAVLITIAAAGAFLTANPAEGAAVLYLYAIAEFLEEYAAGRAHRSIASLLDIAPQTARVRRDEGEVVVPVGEVRVGETVIARPGDTIPLDGVVTLGESSVDQAAITGESIPVAKGWGTRSTPGPGTQTVIWRLW